MLSKLRTLPPVAKASLTSCTMMAAGDAVMQRLQQQHAAAAGKPERLQHDWQRTARFAAVGLIIHGPWFSWGFRQLDKHFGTQPSLKTAFSKVVAGQFTLFPVYLTAFFGAMGLMEGRSLQQCANKLADAWLPTYLTGTAFWPAANMVNFLFVPATMRVAYINAAGLGWNAFLSFANSQMGAKAEAGSAP